LCLSHHRCSLSKSHKAALRKTPGRLREILARGVKQNRRTAAM
jgi:hypothetical protein